MRVYVRVEFLVRPERQSTYGLFARAIVGVPMHMFTSFVALSSRGPFRSLEPPSPPPPFICTYIHWKRENASRARETEQRGARGPAHPPRVVRASLLAATLDQKGNKDVQKRFRTTGAWHNGGQEKERRGEREQLDLRNALRYESTMRR
jgi:hypothetical protein